MMMIILIMNCSETNSNCKSLPDCPQTQHHRELQCSKSSDLSLRTQCDLEGQILGLVILNLKIFLPELFLSTPPSSFVKFVS